jgi:hypothetical protein
MSITPKPFGICTLMGPPAKVRQDLDALAHKGQIVVVMVRGETAEHAARLGDAVHKVLKLVETALLDLTADQLQVLVNTLVPKAPPVPVRLLEAKMKATARKAVLESGDWKTAIEVAQAAGLGLTNLSSQLNNWKRERRIFAINHQGRDYFPAYGLDGEGRPLKGVAEVLEVFGERKDGWNLAYWFAAVNSFLGGKRPQDVLEVNPTRVAAAAQDEMKNMLFG